MQTSRLGKERYTTGEYRKYFSPPCCLVMGSGEDVLNFFPKLGGGGCFFSQECLLIHFAIPNLLVWSDFFSTSPSRDLEESEQEDCNCYIIAFLKENLIYKYKKTVKNADDTETTLQINCQTLINKNVGQACYAHIYVTDGPCKLHFSFRFFRGKNPCIYSVCSVQISSKIWVVEFSPFLRPMPFSCITPELFLWRNAVKKTVKVSMLHPLNSSD